ncbi:N-acetyl-gamma-glutamyl-phosphate reductase [Actinobacillus equuli]|nr:N-acetyl-gamma-glutamyl-phosphate reductase [Actinobacillus equuli]
MALAPANARICDTSTAHRVNPDWTYGFAELSGQFEKIQNANRVAVPGCHATGYIALVRPLIEKGALSADYPLSCYSLTGYSGGGKSMIAEYQTKIVNRNSVPLVFMDSLSNINIYRKCKRLPVQIILLFSHRWLPTITAECW